MSHPRVTSMEDYYVRYGGDGWANRTVYMTEKKAQRKFDKIKLDTEITWKQLVYEPLEIEGTQYIIKEETVEVLDFGFFGKVAIPVKQQKEEHR